MRQHEKLQQALFLPLTTVEPAVSPKQHVKYHSGWSWSVSASLQFCAREGSTGKKGSRKKINAGSLHSGLTELRADGLEQPSPSRVGEGGEKEASASLNEARTRLVYSAGLLYCGAAMPGNQGSQNQPAPFLRKTLALVTNLESITVRCSASISAFPLEHWTAAHVVKAGRPLVVSFLPRPLRASAVLRLSRGRLTVKLPLRIQI